MLVPEHCAGRLWLLGLEESDGAAVPGQETGFSPPVVAAPEDLLLGSAGSKICWNPELLAALRLLGKHSTAWLCAIPDPKLVWAAETFWTV